MPFCESECLTLSSSTNIIPVVNDDNIDSVNINQIPHCQIYTNNPYHDSASRNPDLPEGAIFARLRSLAFICKQCQNGFLVSLDRSQCVRPPSIPNCKSFSNIECQKCQSGFSKQKNLYSELAFQNESSKFDKEEFFNKFFEFGHPYILLDPSQNSYLVRQFGQCKSHSSLANCAMTFSTGVCRVCRNGFFLDRNFECKPNPTQRIPNCLKYISVNSCGECATNFVHQESSTVTILSETVPLYNCRSLQAAEVIAHCLIYKQMGTTVFCTKCQDSHVLDGSTLAFGGGVGYSSACIDRVESKFVGGCMRYSMTEDKCEECVQGLGLGADGLVCLAHIPQCLRYNLDKAGQVVDSQSATSFNLTFRIGLFGMST